MVSVDVKHHVYHLLKDRGNKPHEQFECTAGILIKKDNNNLKTKLSWQFFFCNARMQLISCTKTDFISMIINRGNINKTQSRFKNKIIIIVSFARTKCVFALVS